MAITTDSGISHMFGAYGMRQICLYCPYQPNHFQNFSAMTPVNYKHNLKSLCGYSDINNIDSEEVLDTVRSFK